LSLYFALAIVLIAFSIYSWWLSKIKLRTNMRNDYPWLPPSIGTLKWNVDSSSNNKPRPWGISGVLKDHRGKFLCIFSCSTNNMKFNETT
jgi:hypothetical protein